MLLEPVFDLFRLVLFLVEGKIHLHDETAVFFEFGVVFQLQMSFVLALSIFQGFLQGGADAPALVDLAELEARNGTVFGHCLRE